MKKKGFTLIEVIVVIAIIGVLMTILVPAMIGYIKKSKITAANSTAAELVKTMNAILTDGSESNADFVGIDDGPYNFKGDYGQDLNGVVDTESYSLVSYMEEVNSELTDGQFGVWMKEGLVIAAAFKNGKYYGTYPIGLTIRNYDGIMTPANLKTALEYAHGLADSGSGT